MAMVTITSNSATNISGNLTLENRNSMREASFSSYLDSSEESFVLQLAKSSKKLDSSSSFPQNNLQLGRKKTEYEEIDVFSAEKYFNGGVGEETPKLVHNSSPQDEILESESLKQKNRPGTPSIRSESSGNSRSSLVKVPKNQQARKGINTRGKKFLTSLGCNGSCNDKESVKVHKPGKILDESRHVISPRDDIISLPAFNPKPGNAKNLHTQEKKEEEDTSKKSLEVFGSPLMSIDKQIKMLSAWDAIPQKEIQIDDTESDASSDLFEIESFSTNNNPYLTRQASNGTCYAPSEASIEWSTVTASAADFSVMSDFEEQKFPDRKNMNGKEMQKRRQNLLPGCKSHKAVSIVGDAHRIRDKGCPDLQRNHILESLTPVTTRNGQLRFEALPLAESQFKLAPHLLYMH